MSTRSGKRIHGSFSDNVDSVSEVPIERKTRSKKNKEFDDEVTSTKKKKNFVRRPSNDVVEGSNNNVENISKSVRKSRRNTLREPNVPAVDHEPLNDRKSARPSRRKKEETEELTNLLIQENIKRKKNKKSKKDIIENLENEPAKSYNITKKKSSKKKRKSTSFTVEELMSGEVNKSFNKINVSVDSFHSAAGSPGKDYLKNEAGNNDQLGKYRNRKESSLKTTYDSVEIVMNTQKKHETINKEKYFETLINRSAQLDKLNVIEKEEIENKKKHQKVIPAILKTKTKRKTKKIKEAKFVYDIENTITKDELSNSTELHSSTPSNILTAFSINAPSGYGTANDLDNVLNNSCRLKRKSNSTNSISDNKDISIKLIDKFTDPTDPDKITVNQTFNSQKPRNSMSRDATYVKINLSNSNLDEYFDKTNSFDKNSIAGKKLSLNYKNSSRRESSIQNTTYKSIEDQCVMAMETSFKQETSNYSSADTNSTDKKSRKSSKFSLQEEIASTVLNGTYDKNTNNESTYSCKCIYVNSKSDTTLEKTKDNIDGHKTIHLNPKSSIISSDDTDNITTDISQDCSGISITSDDSRIENMVNTTPLLIESSIEESQINSESMLLSKIATPHKEEPILKVSTQDKQESLSNNDKMTPKRLATETSITPPKRDGTYTELHKPQVPKGNGNLVTPLKREGTFTKESADMISPKPNVVDKTPPRRTSMHSPGRTPFSLSRSSSKGHVILNLTHSIEKSPRRSSIAAAPPRLTKVMFCSPVDNPVAMTQMKGKVIKSSLKGSNKSFMFGESVREMPGGGRKRSRTQLGADDCNKRARTSSAAARLQAPPPAAKSEAKPRTKLPDFAALHQKQFAKMESLDECQRRRARRARALLTPTGTATPTAPTAPSAPSAPTAPTAPTAHPAPTATLPPREVRIIAETSDNVKSQAAERPETPKTKEIDKKNQSYTRFGFKLNLDVNPFSVPPKTTEVNPKDVAKPKPVPRQATLPSLAGATLRKERAKQTIMREKSFTGKVDVNRHQSRTLIKGVRTNRRFELQMKMRNMD